MLGFYLAVTAGIAAFALLFVILSAVMVALSPRNTSLYETDVNNLKGSLIALSLCWAWPVAVLGLIGLTIKGIYKAFKKEKS